MTDPTTGPPDEKRRRGRPEPLDPWLVMWEARMGPVIVCAALVPIVVAFCVGALLPWAILLT